MNVSPPPPADVVLRKKNSVRNLLVPWCPSETSKSIPADGAPEPTELFMFCILTNPILSTLPPKLAIGCSPAVYATDGLITPKNSPELDIVAPMKTAPSPVILISSAPAVTKPIVSAAG